LFEGRLAKVISCEYRYISMQNKNTLVAENQIFFNLKKHDILNKFPIYYR